MVAGKEADEALNERETAKAVWNALRKEICSGSWLGCLTYDFTLVRFLSTGGLHELYRITKEMATGPNAAISRHQGSWLI